MGWFSSDKPKNEQQVIAGPEASVENPGEKLADEMKLLHVGNDVSMNAPPLDPNDPSVTSLAVKEDGRLQPATEADKEKGTVVNVKDIPDGKKKLEQSPHMKEVGELNTFADKAISSAAALYRGVEIVHKGAVPLDLVVTAMVTAVDDFRLLKDELHKFQLQGKLTMEDVLERFGEIMDVCNHITKMVEEKRDPGEIVTRLDEVVMLSQNFLELVGARLKQLQSLRKRTANTWLATTSVASVTVGGAAAAMCVLSGGTALPVLAPLLAFGAGTTAVATASHVAFSPSLGAQIKDMDEQIKQLDDLKMHAGIVGRKAEDKMKVAEIVGVKASKRHWW